MKELVELARRAVETWVRERRLPEVPEEIKSRLGTERPSGVFVCLKRQGMLRGCIGTIQPVTSSVIEETLRNAVAAASQDPRFPAVSEEELEGLEVTVDVLGEPEPVTDPDSELDPDNYGVIVTSGQRRGLLLPDLEGVDSWRRQVAIAMQKAGIGPEEEGVEIERFEIRRYT